MYELTQNSSDNLNLQAYGVRRGPWSKVLKTSDTQEPDLFWAIRGMYPLDETA